MSSQAAKVSEVFLASSEAFRTLGELTRSLASESQKSSSDAKWSEAEVEMLHAAVANFARDLAAVSQRVRQRTLNQINNAVTKKALQDANLSSLDSRPRVSSEVTLNALNAGHNDGSMDGDVQIDNSVDDFNADAKAVL